MKKLILISIFVFLYSVGLVYALPNGTMIAYWPLNETAASCGDAIDFNPVNLGRFNLTETGTVTCVNGEIPSGTSGARGFDANIANFLISDGDNAFSTPFVNNTPMEGTRCSFMNFTATGAQYTIQNIDQVGPGNFYTLRGDSDDTMSSAEAPNLKSTRALARDTYYHVCESWNGSGRYLFIDGVLNASSVAVANITPISTKLLIGVHGDEAAHAMDGTISESVLYNESLPATNISFIFSEYVAGRNGIIELHDSFDPTDTTGPTITFIYPETGTVNNTWNRSIVFTTNEDANTTTNSSSVTLITAESNSTRFVYNYTGTLVSRNYTINFSAWDALENNRTSTWIFTLDLGGLDDTFSLPNNDTLILDRLTFQLNITDDRKLFSLNVTTSGGYVNVTTNINLTTFTFNGAIDTSGLIVGNHTLNYTYCDAHTTKEIPDYDTRTGDFFGLLNKYKITYTFNGLEWSIEPKDYTNFKSASTHKSNDRYIMEYRKTRDSMETFIVTSDDEIEIIGGEQFTGWLVFPHLKKWIDFETPEGYKATLKRIDKNTVEVTTRGSTFQSTGDLNCNDRTFIYYKFGTLANYSSPVVESESAVFILSLNITDTTIVSTETFASLNYNNSVKATTRSNITGEINFTSTIVIQDQSETELEIDFYWNFTIGGTAYNTSTFSQTTSDLRIVDCESDISNTSTINLTIRDEINNDLLLAETDSFFDVWFTTRANKRSFNFSHTNTSTIQWCIFPTTLTFGADIQFQSSEPTLVTTDLIRQNITLDSTLQLFTNYLLSNDNATSVVVIIKDQSDNFLENILIEMEKFDLATGNFTLVETKISNTEGEGVFAVVFNTGFYRFKLYQNFVLKKETNKFQITTLTLNFRLLDRIISRIERLLDIKKLIRTLTFTNSTNIVTFSFEAFPVSLSQVCLNVSYPNQTSVSGECTTTESGQLTYEINLTNQTYSAYAYGVDDGGFSFLLESLAIDLRSGWRTFGAQGIGMSILLYLFVGLMMFSSPILGIIAAIVNMIAIYSFGLMPLGLQSIFGAIAIGIFMIAMMNRGNRG